MEKLSGLVLDFYDDTRGELLRSLYPQRDGLPEIVKTAHFLTPEERQALPDDLFALVLRDGDVVLRKYACIDAGNTLLAWQYLEKVGGKLPEEARRTALENIKTASVWYEEGLKKEAFGMAMLKGLGGLAGSALGAAVKNPIGTLGKVMTAKSIMDTGSQIKNNLQNQNLQNFV